MKTDDLIADLTADLSPTSPRRPLWRILAGLGVGGLASAVLMLAWLGLRPDLAHAVATPMFWMKFAYPLITFVLMTVGLERLSRPGGLLGGLAWGVLAPFGLLAIAASMRLMEADPAVRPIMIMGVSSQVCPWRISVLALPILAGAVWALRGLAPTRLMLAGLLAGGCAGALGAWIYAFHCDESAMPFVAIWYTAGAAIVALAGGLAGRSLLRWS